MQHFLVNSELHETVTIKIHGDLITCDEIDLTGIGKNYAFIFNCAANQTDRTAGSSFNYTLIDDQPAFSTGRSLEFVITCKKILIR